MVKRQSGSHRTLSRTGWADFVFAFHDDDEIGPRMHLILEKLGGGESIEAVLESHPRLTREGVLAALRFAAQALRAEVVYPVSAKSV